MKHIIGVTGHRTTELGGYDAETLELLKAVALSHFQGYDPSETEVITGMGLGWDTACSLAALELEIPLTAAVPFKGQESKWPMYAQVRYNDILSKCKQVHYVSAPNYISWKMMKRNKWIVERSTRIVSLYDGREYGGTYRAIKFAQKRGLVVINLWKDYNERISTV